MRAKPKSQSLTTPSFVIRMFSGFTSLVMKMKKMMMISFGVDDHYDDEPMQAIVEVAEVDRLKSLPDQRLGQSHRHLFNLLS